MPYRILITGSEGFLGRFLSQAALADGATVIRTSTRPEDPAYPDINQLDVTIPEHFDRLISRHKPSHIIHLAGISSPTQTETDPYAEKVVVGGTLNLLEAVAKVRQADLDYNPRIVYYSSVEVYGDGTAGAPIDESAPHAPVNKYGKLKSTAETRFLEFTEKNNLHGIIIQHGQAIGVGQKPDFFIPSVVKQLAEIQALHKQTHDSSTRYTIRTGPVSQKRNLIDARDAAKAVIALMKLSPSLERYIISGDKSISLQDVVDYLIKMSGLPVDHEIVDIGRYPGKDREYSNQKLKQITGWKQEISLEETLSDILSHEISQTEESK